MPKYKYEAMNAVGAGLTSSIYADSEEEAQNKIRQLGYFVTKITLDKTETNAIIQGPMKTVPTLDLILEVLNRFRPRFPTRKCPCCTGDCK